MLEMSGSLFLGLTTWQKDVRHSLPSVVTGWHSGLRPMNICLWRHGGRRKRSEQRKIKTTGNVRKEVLHDQGRRNSHRAKNKGKWIKVGALKMEKQENVWRSHPVSAMIRIYWPVLSKADCQNPEQLRERHTEAMRQRGKGHGTQLKGK